MKKIALIGAGYWGPHYARIFSKMKGVEFTGVYDMRHSIAANLADNYGAKAFATLPDLLLSCDAVVIATPASTHTGLTLRAMNAGKDVLCEKAVTLNTQEHKELLVMARNSGRILMPGLTYLFHNAVKELKGRYIHEEQLGKPKYATAIRTNYGPARHDVNAIQDLAPHDVSILAYLLGEPSEVRAQHLHAIESGPAEAGSLNLRFGSVPAHIFVSWTEPVKRRVLRIVFEKGMVEFDDMSHSPLKEYVFAQQNGKHPHEEVIMGLEDLGEPLTDQCHKFVHLINTREQPVGLQKISHWIAYSIGEGAGPDTKPVTFEQTGSNHA